MVDIVTTSKDPTAIAEAAAKYAEARSTIATARNQPNNPKTTGQIAAMNALAAETIGKLE